MAKYLIDELLKTKKKVLVIDYENKLKDLKSSNLLAINGDATDSEFLKNWSWKKC